MIEPRTYWIVVMLGLGLGLAVRAHSVSAGFGMDDFAQLAMLDGAYPVPRAPWDLFSFSTGDPREVQTLMNHGSLAWWSHPELKLSAFRPLSSLLIALDVRLFGYYAPAHHLHSLLWWSLMLLTAARLLRRILPPRWAMLTVLLYALDECHTYPIGWLANRNAIISATFAFIALDAHIRYREHDVRSGAWISPVSLALAFAGGEYSLCILPFYGLYELIAGPGSRRQRARALLPVAGLVVLYIAIHRGLGFGSYASSVYIDPLREPWPWLLRASVRIPVLLSDLLLALPTGKVALHPWLMSISIALGIVAGPIVGVLLIGVGRRLNRRDRKRLWWLASASLLAILPVASSFASTRLLLIPAIGGHAIIAAILLDAFERLRAVEQRWRASSMARGLWAASLVLAHLGLAPYWGVEDTSTIVRLNRGTWRAALQMPTPDSQIPRQRYVVLVASDPMTLLYPALMRWVDGHPLPRSRWVLSMAAHPHHLTRTDRNAFELEVVGGAMLGGPVERLFRRADAPFRAGDRIALDGMIITIVAVDGAHRPLRVRYTFESALEDPNLVFLVVTARGMQRYPMGPVGATVPIAAAPLPLVLDTPFSAPVEE